MLIYYLQMLDTPEEKVRFEQIYLKYRGLMYRVADSILPTVRTRRTRYITPF